MAATISHVAKPVGRLGVRCCPSRHPLLFSQKLAVRPVLHLARANHPRENIENAEKEIENQPGKAGADEADANPLGGAGFEQADGEGQGYSMKDIAEGTKGTHSAEGSAETSSSSSSSGEFEAGVQDVE